MWKPILLLIALTSVSSAAMLTEPTYQAAEALGYNVVGEIEFARGSTTLHRDQVQDNLHELAEMCPRTQARDRRISSFAKLVVIAWSDLEFPARHKRLPIHSQKLALKRAKAVAEKIRTEIPGTLSFELVNMAHRKPHPIDVTSTGRVRETRYDIKAALEIAGAAPSDLLGVGLFGENSQHSKVVLWVDCTEPLGKRRHNAVPSYQLARRD